MSKELHFCICNITLFYKLVFLTLVLLLKLLFMWGPDDFVTFLINSHFTNRGQLQETYLQALIGYPEL